MRSSRERGASIATGTSMIIDVLILILLHQPSAVSALIIPPSASFPVSRKRINSSSSPRERPYRPSFVLMSKPTKKTSEKAQKQVKRKIPKKTTIKKRPPPISPKTATPPQQSDDISSQYLMEHPWSSLSPALTEKIRSESSYNSALCIIPPDEAWDSIQRARYLANDNSFYKFPPCLRLFHPFAPPPYLASAATAIAEVIGEEEIGGFEVTLDHLVVLPHWEAVKVRKGTRKEEVLDEEEERKRKDIESLIADQERIGLEKRLKRLERENARRRMRGEEELDPAELPPPWTDPKTEKQQTSSAYNGPCILGLEPDTESAARLCELRQQLAGIFKPYRGYSVSSSLQTNSKSKKKFPKKPYRPVLPLGSFDTVEEALEVARELQKSWEPMSFDVVDLQLISSGAGVGSSQGKHSTDTQADSQMGCDALVTLFGCEGDDDQFDEQNEDEQDEDDFLLSLMFRDDKLNATTTTGTAEINEEKGREYSMSQIQELFMLTTREKEGTNYTKDNDYNYDDDLILNDNLSQMLLEDEDDEDWNDEGATIVIGRTQFFLGAMKQYVGMPASNPMDKKL